MKNLIALICRHGETKLNANNQFRSWLDVHLDPVGEKQAEDTADILINYPITEIYSSPLYRTVYTANQFSKKSQIPIQQHRGLFPWNLGVLAGTDKDQNKQLLNMLIENPSVKIPNGESLDDFENRCASFYNDCLLQPEGRKSLKAIFCHTSNIIVLDNILQGVRSHPESVELVKPGGICAVYRTNDWFSIEPIFRATTDKEDF